MRRGRSSIEAWSWRRLIEDGGRVTVDVDEGLNDGGTLERKRPIGGAAKFIRCFRRAAGHAKIVRRRVRGRTDTNSGQRITPPFLLDLHEAEPAVVKHDDRHGQI